MMNAILYNAYTDVITACDKAVSAWRDALAAHEKEFPDNPRGHENVRRYDASLDNLKALKRNAEEKITEMKSKAQECAASEAKGGTTGGLPNKIELGSIRFQERFGNKNHSYFFPRSVDFPLKSALWMPSTGRALHNWVYETLVALFKALPASGLRIYAADPRQSGSSLEPFLPLLHAGNLFPNGRILTNADEIEAMLGERDEYIIRLLQDVFVNGIKDWADYNKVHTSSPLPYSVVLIISAPEQLTDKSIVRLERIITQGPRCGVLPFILLDESMTEGSNNNKFKQFAQGVKDKAARADSAEDLNLSNLDADVCIEKRTSEDELKQLVAQIKEECTKAANTVKDLGEVLRADNAWGESSAKGLCAPIGWDDMNSPVMFSLGDETAHCLLAGKTGSGKSNVISVMVHSLCGRYSPQELQLYILDFKEGVEAKAFVKLPQAKLIATESDAKYGVSVLRHIEEEMKQRSNAFKDAGVKDIADYRDKTGLVMPRIVLVADEFQVLFHEAGASALLDTLLRQGRSAGVHIVLATQTLSGITTKDLTGASIQSLVRNLGMRIALSCTTDDSYLILAQNNSAAASLVPKKEAIMNRQNGQPSGNVKFVHPFADAASCAAHIQKLQQLAHKEGYAPSPIIYEGYKREEMAHSEVFTQAVQSVQDVQSEQDGQSVQDGQSEQVVQSVQSVSDEQSAGDGLVLHLGTAAIGIEQKPLDITLADTDGENILILGEAGGKSQTFHDGLYAAILQSAKLQAYETVEINIADDEDLNKLVQIAQSDDGKKRMVLVEFGKNFSNYYRLAPNASMSAAMSSYALARAKEKSGQAESMSPADAFKKVLEEGPQKGIHTAVFASSWLRFRDNCKAYLGSLFPMRVAYCVNASVAGEFLPDGASGRFTGVEVKDNAVFKDMRTEETTNFMPYIAGGEA